MLPCREMFEAEAALGRNLTWGEAAWFSYTANMHDFWLYAHIIIFVILFYTAAPIPLALIELTRPQSLRKYKIQPKVTLTASEFLRCYKEVIRTFFLVVLPLQLIFYPTIKRVGIRTGFPLPTLREMVAQLGVYFLVEDYFSYWLHRWLHTEWWYEKIHRVHHEFTAPIGFAAPYAHWAEVLILGLPFFLGPLLAPGHIITFGLWTVLRQNEAIDIHKGYEFPLSPTKLIPFYGGADYHDYHHYVGKQSNSNFASVFTYCDYIYGTDKGYRYHKYQGSKLNEQSLNAETRKDD